MHCRTLEIFTGTVNNNLPCYSFPYLDSLSILKQPKIINICGRSDSLKTRLALYLCNSLMSSVQDVYWVSMATYDPFLSHLELDAPENLCLIQENKLEVLADIFRELPMGSHIFIDSVISTVNDHPKYKDKQYYGLGKFLSQFKNEKLFSFYLTSTISGFNHKPITDSFDKMIDYELIIKKVQSKKDFVGREYKVVGNYYSVIDSYSQFTQILYADMKKRITANMVNFFWQVSQGLVVKTARTYFKDGEPLGSNVLTILKNHSF
jgi:hypothetical protein